MARLTKSVRMKRYHEGRPRMRLYHNAIARARALNLPWTITLDDIVVPTHCPALGIPLQLNGPRGVGSASLDRLRPELGYVPENIAVISDLANKIKSNATSAEVAAVAEWMKSKGL